MLTPEGRDRAQSYLDALEVLEDLKKSGGVEDFFDDDPEEEDAFFDDDCDPVGYCDCGCPLGVRGENVCRKCQAASAQAGEDEDE